MNSLDHGTVHCGPSRTRIENYDKFHKYALSFHDQVYLTFLDQGVQSLNFEKIQNELFNRFGTDNVSIGDVSRLRFIYSEEGGDIFTIYLQSDDICPRGLKCTKDNSSCQRLHTVIQEHVCLNTTFPSMWCKDRNCALVHLFRPRLRDNILSVILYIFKRHKRQYQDLTLCDLRIPDYEFIATFSKLYPNRSPIPNITELRWKRLIHRYCKYYIDYHYQRQWVDRPYHEHVTYLKLWRTERIGDRWHIRMTRGVAFIVSRVCRRWMDPETTCPFRPQSFCSYFHLDKNCVALDNAKVDWWINEKWIFNRSVQEKV